MSESNETSPGMTEEVNQRQMNIIERTIGVFAAPTKTFEDIAAKPNWIFPLLLIIILTMLITQMLVPAILADQQSSPEWAKMMQNPDLTAEQLEAMQEMSTKGVQNFAAIGAGVVSLIAIAIASVVLLFVGNIILGGNAKYLQIFSMFTWGGLVGLSGYILRLPLSLSRETMQVYLGPAVLFGDGSHESVLFKIAAALDIFVLWRVALVAIGFGAIYRLTAGKSFAVIGGLYALMVAASIIFSSVF